MVGLIFGIIFILLGIVATIFFALYKDYDGETMLRKFTALPLAAGILIGGLTTFLGCTTTVETGNTGVVTVFGKVEAKHLTQVFTSKCHGRRLFR